MNCGSNTFIYNVFLSFFFSYWWHKWLHTKFVSLTLLLKERSPIKNHVYDIFSLHSIDFFPLKEYIINRFSLLDTHGV